MLIAIGLVAAIYGMPMFYNIMNMTNTNAPGFLGAFRLFLAIGGTVVGFLAPALVFAYLLMRDPVEYIGLKNYTPWILLPIAALIMISFIPTIDITAYFNQKMTLPASWSGLYKWIREMESSAMAQFKVLLNMRTPADLIISIGIIAVLPAIAEEFFFRGCLQSVLMRSTGSVHGGVWIAAFIFSFIHMEFFGFIPRLLLGAAMGYLYAWSGSIWPSVVMHFVNNAFSVVAVYLHQHKMIAADPDSGQPMFGHWWVYVLTFLLSIGLMYLYRQVTIKKQLLIADGEELGEDIHVD
ncbi:CPBP family intramembrane metalloprotease [Mucilaginibacter myungsuensis]